MDSLKFDCNLWMVFCEQLLAWLAVCLGLAISQTTCGMYSTGSQFNSASSIGSPLLSGIVFLVTRLLICCNSLSWRRPALVSDLSARPPRGTFWCHVLALPPMPTIQKMAFSIVGPSVWNDLPLNSVLFRVTFPVLFINSSRLSSLAEPGLGASLSSYLEGALYKLIAR